MKCRFAALILPILMVSASAEQAKIQTSMGDIVIALDDEHAPKTVANFIAYAKAGHFNGTAVYRVVPGFVVQMGSIKADGKGKPPARKPIPLESANGVRNLRGAVAMAHGDPPASARAEFFIDLRDNTPLDPKPGDAPGTTGYAVFGHVVAGMDVVDAIAAVPLGGGKGPFPDAMPKTPVRVLKISVGQFVDNPPPANCFAGDPAERVRAVFAKVMKQDATALSGETALPADSLDRLELAVGLEDDLGIQLADDPFAGAVTLGDVVRIVERALADAHKVPCSPP